MKNVENLLRNGDNSLNIFLFVVVLMESYILIRKKITCQVEKKQRKCNNLDSLYTASIYSRPTSSDSLPSY